MFQVIGLALLLPVAGLASWLGFIARQPPGLPQELARASHGAAMIAFALLFAFGVFGLHDVGSFARALLRHPDDSSLWIPAAIWAGMLVWGLTWLVIGAGRTRMPFVDAHFMSRAVAKTGFGLVVGYVVWKGLVPAVFGSAPNDPFIVLGLTLLAIWCAVTGVTKILLLARGVKRTAPAPPAHPSPRGRAGDAAEHEAHQAMRGGGGDRLPLDDRQF